MIKKQLVSTGIILALLGSNIIISQSYINTNNEYENKIKSQSKLIEQSRVDMKFLTNVIEIKLNENNDLLNRIDIMNKQIEKFKKDNMKLKKTLKERKEANRQPKFFMEATAYTAMCSEGCTGKTFTEYDVRNTIYYKGLRIIASDNTVLPLNSIIRIDTKTESFNAIVLDRGGGIDNFEIDLLVKNESIARKFGRQKVLVTILKEGEV